MIKKNGWNEREKEGANIVYEKDDHFINLAVATDYIAVTKYTKILLNNSYVTIMDYFQFFKFKNKRGGIEIRIK